MIEKGSESIEHSAEKAMIDHFDGVSTWAWRCGLFYRHHSMKATKVRVEIAQWLIGAAKFRSINDGQKSINMEWWMRIEDTIMAAKILDFLLDHPSVDHPEYAHRKAEKETDAVKHQTQLKSEESIDESKEITEDVQETPELSLDLSGCSAKSNDWMRMVLHIP